MDLSIIIVSFRSGDIIRRCLESIDRKYPIIVVENSHDDHLKSKIESEYSNVKFILPKENLGYGAANNLGIKEAKTNYVLILNPDTILLKDTLEQLLSHASKIEDFAILGPNIIDENITIDNKNLNDHENNKEKSVSYIKGFAVFINKSQFKEIGYFDEKFFLYFEEIDLCKRIIKKGKKIFFIPKALIKHSGGQSHSRDINNKMELNRNWHWMWSTFYFYKKHNGMLYAFIKIFTKLISSFLKVIFFTVTLQNKKKEIYSHRLSGIINSIMGKKSWYRPNLD